MAQLETGDGVGAMRVAVVTMAGNGHPSGHAGRIWHCIKSRHDQFMPA